MSGGEFLEVSIAASQLRRIAARAGSIDQTVSLFDRDLDQAIKSVDHPRQRYLPQFAIPERHAHDFALFDLRSFRVPDQAVIEIPIVLFGRVSTERLGLEPVHRDPLEELRDQVGVLPRQFVTSREAFLRDLQAMLAQGQEGLFVAYIDGQAVDKDQDELALLERVASRHRKDPDYIGYVSDSGVRQTALL